MSGRLRWNTLRETLTGGFRQTLVIRPKNQIGFDQASAFSITDRDQEARAEATGGDPTPGIHHDHADLMMRSKITDPFDPLESLDHRIAGCAASPQGLHRHRSGTDARNEFTGAGGDRLPDSGIDEDTVSGDRRITNPAGNLERKAAGRTGGPEASSLITGKDPDGVVTGGSRTFSIGGSGAEQTSTGLGSESRINGTESGIRLTSIRFPSSIPGFPGLASLRRQKFG